MAAVSALISKYRTLFAGFPYYGDPERFREETAFDSRFRAPCVDLLPRLRPACVVDELG